jgi:hypothetical protein
MAIEGAPDPPQPALDVEGVRVYRPLPSDAEHSAGETAQAQLTADAIAPVMNVPPVSPRIRPALLTTIAGAALLLVTMFLPRVQAQANEDFFGEYYGTQPPLGADAPPSANAWFFTVPSAGTLTLVLLALGVGLAGLLRPALMPKLVGLCWGVGVPLFMWVLLTTVLFPGLDSPPWDRLSATWIAMAATVLATIGLMVAAVESG